MSAHPAVDVLTRRSAVVVQDRPLVPLSSWLTDVMARCATSGLAVQVLTPHDARITLPLRMALGGPKARWVVQEPGDGYYDGFSGLPLEWDGAVFAPVRQETPRPSDAYLVEPPAGLGHHLVVDLRLVHEPTSALELGGAVDGLARTLAGTSPRSWGTAEPALARWSPSELTALARRRAPQATFLTFMGPHDAADGPRFGGTARVSRVTSGVKETVTFAVAYEPGRPPPLEELAAVADGHARAGTLLTMTVQWVPGRADLTYPPRWQGAAVPVALAVGPEGVAETGAEHMAAAPVEGRVIGDDARPGMWYVLGDGTDTAAWGRLGDLMGRLRTSGK
ncbi:DUF6177 family protein [Thermomonospora amylolytica]|uniref:DUF6177 family protein n=1 Tax=Thermomonospora amylolytica TaxID=1411117 RepID=UPI000E6C8DCD|nr:DUF6177 family protein [Thermomonospora amylolytica]